MKRYVIAVDIGTTSTKSVLFTLTGERVTQHLIGYPLNTPVPQAAEQDPDAIYQAILQSVKWLTTAINPSEILCLSFSTAMHSLIAVDREGKLLTQSITWADNRSAQWANHLKQDPFGHALYHRTGTPIHPMSPLVKLIWLRNEHPELFERSAKFISIKEYILYRLFQQYIVDYSIAAATGLLNLKELSWDPEALKIAGITEDRLSKLVPTTHVVSGMNQTVAKEMGILANTPIVVGASDGVLANLSVGAIVPGVVAVSLGTSGAIRAVIDRPQTDVQERLFCYPLTEAYWVIGGAVNNGGIILRWLLNCLGTEEIAIAQQTGQDPYDLSIDLAQTVSPGAEGLIFYPYLAGERSPLWNPNASGSFMGLTLRHTKAHLIRAVLEGIIFNLYLVGRALQEKTGQITTIQATGGLMSSPFFRQLLADVFQCEIQVPETYESAGLGAAVLGLYALGYLSDLKAVSQMIGPTSHHRPLPENTVRYQKILPIYTEILEGLQSQYANLSALATTLQEI